MAEEKLIEAVRSFPCIWQVSNKSYKDIKARENAWKAISEQVEGLSPEECSKRWKSLRDKFVRELKKVKYRKTGESGPVYVSCWVYFNVMLFLEDSIRHKPTASNYVVKLENDSDQFPSAIDVELQRNSLPSVSESESASEVTDTNYLSCTSPIVLSPPPVRSPPTPQPPIKKRKVNSKTDEVDLMILDNLKDLNSKRASTQLELAEEDLFGKEVALVLKRLHPRQKAMAKMEIHQILFKYEFPIDDQSDGNSN